MWVAGVERISSQRLLHQRHLLGSAHPTHDGRLIGFQPALVKTLKISRHACHETAHMRYFHQVEGAAARTTAYHGKTTAHQRVL